MNLYSISRCGTHNALKCMFLSMPVTMIIIDVSLHISLPVIPGNFAFMNRMYIAQYEIKIHIELMVKVCDVLRGYVRR